MVYMAKLNCAKDARPCKRCPDYLPDGGVWRLWLERGVFRVHFLVTGWRSVGSFTLTDDRITFFNDPTCGSEVGIYEWERKERSLILKVIDDPCMFGLRAANFSNLPWDSCQPPNREASCHRSLAQTQRMLKAIFC